MSTTTYLSKSSHAARISRSPSYITRLMENGRLVLSPNRKQVNVLTHRSVDSRYRLTEQGCRRCSPPTGPDSA